MFSENFHLDIEKIHIAHKFVLGRIHKCAYPSGRGHYGLVYVLEGRAEYRFHTGDPITLTDGDMLLLSPNASYWVGVEKELAHYTVNFDIHEESSRLGFLNRPYCLLRNVDTEQLKRKIIELTDIWTAKKAGFEMQSIGCLYELCSLFYFSYTNEKSKTSYHRLLPAKEHIDRHYNQPISLEQLAKLSYMSETNFRREWKKLYAESPLQYRDSVRLYYAKEYLSSGFYTISEIAEKCGFEEASYFVRFFKKQMGITPGAYKKQIMGK